MKPNDKLLSASPPRGGSRPTFVVLLAITLAGCATPRLTPRSAICTFAVVVAPLAGCESTPFASDELDQEAKRFAPSVGESQLYVARPSIVGAAKLWPLQVDDTPAAWLSAGTYAMVKTTPGLHRLTVLRSERKYTLDIVAGDGANVFVEAEASLGFTEARVELRVISMERGKNLVLAARRVAPSSDATVHR